MAAATECVEIAYSVRAANSARDAMVRIERGIVGGAQAVHTAVLVSNEDRSFQLVPICLVRWLAHGWNSQHQSTEFALAVDAA